MLLLNHFIIFKQIGAGWLHSMDSTVVECIQKIQRGTLGCNPSVISAARRLYAGLPAVTCPECCILASLYPAVACHLLHCSLDTETFELLPDKDGISPFRSCVCGCTQQKCTCSRRASCNNLHGFGASYKHLMPVTCIEILWFPASFQASLGCVYRAQFPFNLLSLTCS